VLGGLLLPDHLPLKVEPKVPLSRPRETRGREGALPSGPSMSTRDWHREQRDGIEACCRELVEERVIEPLSTEEGETRRWNLWLLASLAEGHLHERLDVARLTEDERLAYQRRLVEGDRPLPNPHDGYWTPFWLLTESRRIGTIAPATMYLGKDLLSIASLYVEPRARRRNVARRALEGFYRAAVAHGAGGIRLETRWTWQPAVRFYARIGMWVRMWKHDLVFTWQPDLPPYRVEFEGSEARFRIERDGGWQILVTARHLGDRLGWEPQGLQGQPWEVAHGVPGTFALHLALAGWPLIRSEETWARRYDWSDSGEPEGLAYKIEIFEAVDRERGFEVRTPRIPGMEYRGLEEI
jgi:ribosomal protein S18 acetylase RimI-like enzyme